MYIGVDYYPEHWPRERWETDAKLMKEAGFNIVRLAEFAWIDMEPREGQFEFAWLDDAVKLLARYDIDVILGTPTAVMPAWVARSTRETLRTKADGTQIVWGGRKHNCYSNADYRLLSERITRAMAEHFAKTPNVIGWQIDNEFGGEECHCRSCLAEFQDVAAEQVRHARYAQRRLGQSLLGPEVHRLGRDHDPRRQPRTGPGSWAIPAPASTGSGSSPGSRPASRRTRSRSSGRSAPMTSSRTTSWACSRTWTTTRWREDLDFVTWDNYPIWSDKPDIPYSASLAADLMRGLKQKNFMIMEQTAGPCGWEAFGRNPWPGEIRKIAYQQLAHGSDGQIWFRWRTCTVGREQYWHGLLGHDGKPLRRYQEAAQTAQGIPPAWRVTCAARRSLRRSRSSMITTISGPWTSSRALRATACRARSGATTTPSFAPASMRTS